MVFSCGTFCLRSYIKLIIIYILNGLYEVVLDDIDFIYFRLPVNLYLKDEVGTLLCIEFLGFHGKVCSKDGGL